MFSRIIRWALSLAAEHEVKDLQNRLKLAESIIGSHRQRLERFEDVMGGIKLGADYGTGRGTPNGSWVVIAYKVGDRQFVNFYDFGDRNVGALRDFLERFRKAGVAVLAKSPFNRSSRA